MTKYFLLKHKEIGCVRFYIKDNLYLRVVGSDFKYIHKSMYSNSLLNINSYFEIIKDLEVKPSECKLKLLGLI